MRSAFVFAVLVIVTHGPTLRLGFLLDDHKVIEQNETLRQWSFENMKRDFTSNVFNDPSEAAFYRPLLTLSERIDYSLWGLRPVGFRLTNLAFLAGCSFMLYLFLLRLRIQEHVASLCAALLSVHPVAVDLSMVASARGEQMAFFFQLTSLYLLLNERNAHRILGVVAGGLALLCKESAVVTPFLLVLCLLYLKSTARDWRWVGAWILLEIPFFLWRSWLHSPIWPMSLFWVLKFMMVEFPLALWHYVRLIIFPWPLYYPHMMPPGSHWALWWFAALALLSGLLWFKSRLGLFCFGWFVTMILPKAPSLMQGSAMVHWGYPAASAILLPVSLGLGQRGAVWSRCLFRFLAILLMVLGAALVHLNVALRETDEKSYRWNIRFGPMPTSHYRLGVILLQAGKAQEAVPHLEEAFRQLPEDPNPANVLALAYWHSGLRARGYALMKTTATRYPSFAPAQTNLTRMERERATPARDSNPSRGHP